MTTSRPGALITSTTVPETIPVEVFSVSPDGSVSLVTAYVIGLVRPIGVTVDVIVLPRSMFVKSIVEGERSPAL